MTVCPLKRSLMQSAKDRLYFQYNSRIEKGEAHGSPFLVKK